MPRAVPVLAVVVACACLAPRAQAQSMPGIPGGNVVATAPTEDDGTAVSTTRPLRFASLSLIAARPGWVALIPISRRAGAQRATLHDRYPSRTRRAVGTR